ncbi:hypothetical protein MRB53_011285 [Persea americana]|uniref:Uncharacterized protein n=1 Tax=Persea americana TaxID=3435 RepID=A0ACC2LUY8_PERAE|nr:hypothetical protein MRB53_011285 [Persea americana]
MDEGEETDLFPISQQHRELMAAETLESDFDVAFQFQLQEAIAASLLHQQPPSTSSSLLLHHPSLPDSISLNTDSQPDTDDLSSIMKLQTLELERVQQERKDREICDAEMRRIASDLKIRAHDHSFAREIDRMADEDWDEYGDDFERPIDGDGACSSSSLASTEEPYRLYFKGLVAYEVKDTRIVSQSAIGVAICDPRDVPLLQIRKPLMGAEMSRGVVEAKALIEGLNAVLSLGIKNVEVYCHYVPLYNQVTGKWTVKQRKIANLIDQVYPLQRKLEKCQMRLLPRCDLKLASKLAREAIDSLMTRTIESDDKTPKETCTICLEDNDVSQIFVVDGCLHRYCFSCMKQHVEVKLLQGVLPGCPKDGCPTKLNVDSSRKFLPSRLIEIMAQRIKEASIPEIDRLYCPFPKCSALMSKREMMCPQEESSSMHQANYRSGLRKCVKCDGLFCLNCKVPWHVNMSCSDYKRFNPHARAEDAKLQSLARQKLWRQCIKCKHMIELAEGCYHMTCRYSFLMLLDLLLLSNTVPLLMDTSMLQRSIQV